jgi:sodium transport system ATP-binding protein
MIQVNQLYKSFGKVTALQGITFVAPDGQITGLLGPNGAGKTTCLRSAHPARPTTARRSSIIMVSPAARCNAASAPARQSGLYPLLTARENIRCMVVCGLAGQPGKAHRQPDSLARYAGHHRPRTGFSSASVSKSPSLALIHGRPTSCS